MSPRSERATQNRTAILEAAAEILAERGFHGMSMRDLAKATGKGLSSLYTYFESKEEVLFLLQSEAFRALIENARKALLTASDATARFHIFIYHHVRYVAGHRAIMRVLVHEAGTLSREQRSKVRELKEEYFNLGQDLLKDLLKASCETHAWPPEGWNTGELERVTYHLFGMMNWLFGWYEPARHGTPEEIALSIHKTLLCGLFADCPYRLVGRDIIPNMANLEMPPLLGFAGEGA